MPSPSVNVDAMRDMIEQMLGRVVATASAQAPVATLTPEELAMRTEARDTLVRHLTDMRGALDRTISTLGGTTASRITPQILEGAIDPVVASLDAAFLAAHPSLAPVRAARGEE